MPLAASPLVCLALAAVSVASVEAPRPAPTVELRHRFAAGEILRERAENTSTLTVVKGQTRQTTYNRSETDQRYKVESVDAQGVATLQMTIEGVRMEYAFDGAEPTIFDSRKKNLPAGVEKAIGIPIAEVRVRPDGVVESVKPLLSVAELDQIPGKLGLGGDAEKELFVPLPAGRVGVGATWHDTVIARVSPGGQLVQQVKVLRQYRLTSVDRGVATIGITTRVISPVTEPSLLAQLIQRTAVGTIRFDIETGRVIERTLNVDNTEIGCHGADSLLRVVSTFARRPLTEPTTVSSR